GRAGGPAAGPGSGDGRGAGPQALVGPAGPARHAGHPGARGGGDLVARARGRGGPPVPDHDVRSRRGRGGGGRARGRPCRPAVRSGGVLGIGLAALADRRGRRRILLAALLTSIAATAAGAFAPNLVALVATQAINRGAWAAGGIVLAIILAEEMPAGARAYAL